jgi:hypothetical protein
LVFRRPVVVAREEQLPDTSAAIERRAVWKLEMSNFFSFDCF